MLDDTNPDGVNSSAPALHALILEDDPRDAKLMASVLQSAGLTVQYEVTDSREFFRERLQRNDYDVILADFNLRSWTAIDALETLKRSGKDIPLIVVTGSLGDEAAVECIKRGAADFVLKDRPARLPAAVQRALEERRLRAENMLASERIARLATIVESSDDAIIGKTLEGVITSWNQGAERLYGYSAAEIVGQRVSILTPSDRLEEVAQILARLRQGQRVEHYESVRIRKDGSPVDVSLSIFPLTNTLEGISGAASIARDITDRKRAERKLRESEERFRMLFAGNPLPMWVYDLETLCFIEVNDATVAQYGYSRAEFVSLRITDIRPAEDIRLLAGNLAQKRPTLEESEICRHQLKNGQNILAQITTHLLSWNGRASALVVAQDITARARAELALRESEERYRALFERNLAGVFRTTMDGRILECNQAMANILGFHSPREVQSLWMTGLFYSDQDLAKFNEKLKVDGRLTNFEMRLRRKDASPAWLIANVSLMTQAPNGQQVIEGTFIDITERKRAGA